MGVENQVSTRTGVNLSYEGLLEVGEGEEDSIRTGCTSPACLSLAEPCL